MKTYLPLSLLGSLQFILVTGSAGEVVFNPNAAVGSANTGDFSIAGFNVSYEVCVPDPRYAAVLQNIASNPSEGGLSLAFESTICTAGGQITGGAGPVAALQETTIITSRATSHLLRTSLVLIPPTAIASLGWPSQSCFSHGGTYAYQNRVGSLVYPQISAQGDADMFNLAMEAYGSVSQENGTCVNRQTWGLSTGLTSVQGTPTIYESTQFAASATASQPSGGGFIFGYSDSFIPSYGFRTVKGNSEELDVDGINLSASSGSQLITTLVSAPPTNYVPYVTLVALKFINARGGAVSVQGA